MGGVGGGVLETAAGCVPAASRSRFVTRPPGPEPVTSRRSTPASRAMRFASGDAFTRVASAGVGAGVAGSAGAEVVDGALTTDDGERAAGAAGPAAEIASPGAPMYATGSPTGTVFPSGTRIF